MITGKRFGAVVATALAIPLFADANQTMTVRDSRELRQAAVRARPGTIIRLEPGRYDGGVTIAELRGESGAPIVIAGDDPQDPPVFVGGGSGLHLQAPRHVILRDMIFESARGNGVNIDDGGDRDRPAEHLTIERLVIRDTGAGGNQDALKLSGVDRFTVRDCVFENWGRGGSGIDMVGCHHGEIVGCRLSHPHADSGSGVQIKGGSAEIRVRDCLFFDAGSRAINIGGSTGMPYFRPKPQGYEAKDVVVEDCRFVGSAAPIAFVGVDGAAVRRNTIYAPQRWVVRILQETRRPDFVPCRNGRFERNIIVFDSREVRTVFNIGDGTAPETFSFAENAWFCLDRPDRTQSLVRPPTPERGGIYGVDPELVAPDDPEEPDLGLSPESSLIGYGARQQGR